MWSRKIDFKIDQREIVSFKYSQQSATLSSPAACLLEFCKCITMATRTSFLSLKYTYVDSYIPSTYI